MLDHQNTPETLSQAVMQANNVNFISILVKRNHIIALTESYLKLKIREYEETGKGSFILSDLIRTNWDYPLVPFYEMYGKNQKTAGTQMGKLLKKVAIEMGLAHKRENRFGRKDAITRYFYI